MTTASMDEWAWLFEEGGQLRYMVQLSDLAVLAWSDPGLGVPRFTALNPKTGKLSEPGPDPVEVLTEVTPDVGWVDMLARLKADKQEDPLDRLEAIAAGLEQRGYANRQEVEEAARRIRAAVRRIQSQPRRARLTDAQVKRAAEAVVEWFKVKGDRGLAAREHIIQLIRQTLG